MKRETFLESFGHIADAAGGIDSLRELILDLAMRGSLTERNADDEPAAALLQRALGAKAARIDAGLIRRPKTYSAIEPHEEPYTLPDGWAWSRTVDLIHTVNGRAFKPSDWSGSGLPIIRIQNLNNAAAPFNYFSGEVDAAHLVEPGDLLISWSGTPGTSFGAFVWSGPAGVLNQHIFKCSLFGGYRDFICLAINSRLDVLIGDAHGGVGLQHFTKDKLERLTLAIPPFEEQRRIVERVEDLMDLCDELEQQQAARTELRKAVTASTFHRVSEADGVDDLRGAVGSFADNIGIHLAPGEGDTDALKRLRATILDLAVRGRLVRPNPRDEPASALLGRMFAKRTRLVEAKEVRTPAALPSLTEGETYATPQHWVWTRFGNLFSRVGAGSTPAGGERAYVSDGVMFLRSQNVHNAGLVLNGVARIPATTHERMAGTKVRGGDILLNITGASIGRSAVVPTDGWTTANVNQHVSVLRPLAPETTEYLHLLIISPYFQRLIASSSPGASREGLAIKRMVLFPVPIPPVAAQHRIVERVHELMLLCDEFEQLLGTAREARIGLSRSVIARAGR